MHQIVTKLIRLTRTAAEHISFASRDVAFHSFPIRSMAYSTPVLSNSVTNTNTIENQRIAISTAVSPTIKDAGPNTIKSRISNRNGSSERHAVPIPRNEHDNLFHNRGTNAKLNIFNYHLPNIVSFPTISTA